MKNKFALLLLLALMLLPAVKALEPSNLQRTLDKGDSFLFQLDSKTTGLKLSKIGDTDSGKYVEVQINSRYTTFPVKYRISSGETKAVDVNLDGFNELSITLQSATTSKATLLLQESEKPASLVAAEPAKVIKAAQPVVQEEETQPAAQAITGEAVKEASSNKGKVIGWTVLVAVIIIGIVVYAVTRKKPSLTNPAG